MKKASPPSIADGDLLLSHVLLEQVEAFVNSLGEDVVTVWVDNFRDAYKRGGASNNLCFDVELRDSNGDPFETESHTSAVTKLVEILETWGEEMDADVEVKPSKLVEWVAGHVMLADEFALWRARREAKEIESCMGKGQGTASRAGPRV